MNSLNKLNTDQPPIKVESEWAELKECVYGSPDHWVLPLIYNDSRLRAQGEFGKFWLKNAGRDMKDASPELFNELSTQIKGAINFLETSGVRVHVAGTISPENRKFPRGEDHGVSTPWMRDPFVTIGTNVIELAQIEGGVWNKTCLKFLDGTETMILHMLKYFLVTPYSYDVYDEAKDEFDLEMITEAY